MAEKVEFASSPSLIKRVFQFAAEKKSTYIISIFFLKEEKGSLASIHRNGIRFN